MICSKKQIKLSKQPHYEHRADSSLSISISNSERSSKKQFSSPNPVSTNDSETTPRRSSRTPTLMNYSEDGPEIEEIINDDSPVEEIQLSDQVKTSFLIENVLIN